MEACQRHVRAAQVSLVTETGLFPCSVQLALPCPMQGLHPKSLEGAGGGGKGDKERRTGRARGKPKDASTSFHTSVVYIYVTAATVWDRRGNRRKQDGC